MEFLFRTIQTVSSFVLGVFGVQHPVEEPELIVESSYEVSATTTVAVPETVSTTSPSGPVVPAKKTTPAPTASKASVSLPPASTVTPSVAPTIAPATTPARSSGSGGSAPALLPTKLSIDTSSLKKVSEKNAIKLKALLTMSDGSTKDVSGEVSWELVGSVGSIQGGVFTAKLDSSIAEFGHGPGAIHATFKDSISGKEFTADTGIFDVAAFIPTINSSGQ